ncbi:MAG TPA: LamG-like jellyroll fold domain-containing protein [Planctomycetota bacterium]|nr:LamG-like jellyroll fold domain-containing protein [Planctomycetota bacterium]
MRMRTVVLACLVLCGGRGVGAGEAGGAAPTLDVRVRLELASKGELTASDVTLAAFPGGKRCAFTFGGCRQPATIAALTKLGFRTTVYCGPGTPAETLRALEAAGADIGIDIWGGKGTYASHIGANTVQEAFDAVATSRIVLRAKCDGALACGAIGGHYSPQSFPTDRSPENRAGFGYAYHDANYLLLSDNKPYMVYLDRERPKLLAHRENFDNRLDSRNVPNELIYYQLLANQFRGTLQRAERGQVVRFTLRDFKAADLDECAAIIGPYGAHEQIWHASEADIGANEYARNKVRVKSVKAEGDVAEVVLAIEEDTFPPFLLTPLPLALPASVKVRKATVAGVECAVTQREEGTVVDVPLQKALGGGLKMTVRPAAPDMTAPDRMELTLTLENASGEPIKAARLRWVGSIGFRVEGGPAAPFDLPPKGKLQTTATAATTRDARFGVTPFQAIVAAEPDRVLMAGFEVVVAPRLRVAVDPMQRVPMVPGRHQHFLVHVDNKRSTRSGGPPDTLISHKAGPCKGTVGLELPKGMTASPAEQPFELGEHEERTLVFKVQNESWGDVEEMVRPVIRFAGEEQAVAVLFPGTTVIRDKAKLHVEPFDELGLIAEATWDDRAKNGRFDRCRGNPAAHFYPGHRAAYHNEGVKGWCMNSQGVCQIHETFRNIDYWEGTACFWVRKDPSKRNEMTYVPDPAATAKMACGRSNDGETLFCAGLVQSVASSDSGLTLRRFRSWQGKPGYLQLTYQLMGRRLVACQAGPFEWSETWRHVACLWSVKERRLELYLDGKLAAKAEPGEGEWHAAPWDTGGPSGWPLILISSDHGLWSGTCRDEVAIYNRALTPEQIRVNMAKAKSP